MLICTHTPLLRSAHLSTSNCHRCTNAFALAQVVPQNGAPKHSFLYLFFHLFLFSLFFFLSLRHFFFSLSLSLSFVVSFSPSLFVSLSVVYCREGPARDVDSTSKPWPLSVRDEGQQSGQENVATVAVTPSQWSVGGVHTILRTTF